MSFAKHIPTLNAEVSATKHELFTNDHLTAEQVMALLEKGAKLNNSILTPLNLERQEQQNAAKAEQDRRKAEKELARRGNLIVTP